MADQWLPQFTHQDMPEMEEKEVFSGYSRIKQYRFRFPLFKGGESTLIQREVFVRPPAVAVLLYDPDTNQVVLIEQFRIGALGESESPWILEIVAGVIDEGDTPVQTAIRETLEETGYSIQSLIPICHCFVTPGLSNEKIYIYCAKINAKTEGGIYGLTDHGEDIKVHLMDREKAFQLLSQGKIISAPTIMALQWLQVNYSSLRFPPKIE
jgi:ADP-ribose pyrophosphatase